MKALLAVACAASYGFAQTFAGSAALDGAAEQAIREGLIPGAVIVVGHDGKIVHRKAYGARSVVPTREAATIDTIYDVASLTKVVATTPAIMKLYDQGKIKIDDPVTAYLPEFQGGKSAITIRNLMAHFSGCGRIWTSIHPGAATIRAFARRSPTSQPGRQASVSCIATSISSCWARLCIA